MSHIVGVELSVDGVRAVAFERWRSAPGATHATDWDPARPREVVAALRARLGPTTRIALSVGLGFLHLKHVKLPPAPRADRRRIIALEPDRFFPVQGEPQVVALASEQSLAFAIDADLLDRWIAAFEEWAPVDYIEPAPLSLARAVGAAVKGSFAVPAGAGELGLVELDAGRVRAVRRIPKVAGVASAQALSEHAGVPAEFLFAFGAARGVDGALDAALLPDSLGARIRRRRQLRAASAAIACVGALLLALWALDRSRERVLDGIRAEIAALTPAAASALDLHERLTALERESAAIAQLSPRRANPLLVLAALSEHLPPDATVLNVRSNGAEWQIDGTASDAAAIVPLLDRDDRFEAVRILSASARFREGDRTYETFSIAFRVRAPA